MNKGMPERYEMAKQLLSPRDGLSFVCASFDDNAMNKEGGGMVLVLGNNEQISIMIHCLLRSMDRNKLMPLFLHTLQAYLKGEERGDSFVEEVDYQDIIRGQKEDAAQ